MPKLWNETIEAHRGQVREAILDAAGELASDRGLRGVTMSQIAERAGIGRATLYKYFSDVEAILRTWHVRRIDGHLRELAAVRDGAGMPGERLAAVLTSYAHIARQSRGHDRELVTFLHPDEQVVHAHNQLRELIGQLVEEGVRSGDLRDDVPAAELAAYSLHALGAAAETSDDAGIARLVALTMGALTSRP
ncbi:TetR/AcrR family transcriptional regulator [Nocardia sp. NPDC004340]